MLSVDKKFILCMILHAKYKHHNPNITECALEFIHHIPKLEKVQSVDKVYHKKTVGNETIDVLIEVDGYYIIIENSPITSIYESNFWDLKIEKQKQALINSGIDEDKIISVYYKVKKSHHPEPKVDFCFDYRFIKPEDQVRLVDILIKYKYKIKNAFFQSYLTDLIIEFDNTNDFFAWQYKSIDSWTITDQENFIRYCIKFKLLPDNTDHGRVSPGYYDHNGIFSPKGLPFYGAWWKFTAPKAFVNLVGDYFDSVYLQLGENGIEVRFSNHHSRTSYAMRPATDAIREFFKSGVFDFQFSQRVQYNRNTMHIGYLTYNEKNYVERIKKMDEVFDEMVKNLRLP